MVGKAHPTRWRAEATTNEETWANFLLRTNSNRGANELELKRTARTNSNSNARRERSQSHGANELKLAARFGFAKRTHFRRIVFFRKPLSIKLCAVACVGASATRGRVGKRVALFSSIRNGSILTPLRAPCEKDVGEVHYDLSTKCRAHSAR